MTATAEAFEAALYNLLSDEEAVGTALAEADINVNEDEPIERLVTFEEAMLLTSDRGLVVRLTDGAEFHLTIVKSA